MPITEKQRAAMYSDPRWQKKRLEVFNIDGFMCIGCGDDRSTLNAHHVRYFGNPWDVSIDWIVTQCSDCHKSLGRHPKGGVWIEGGDFCYSHCPSCGQSFFSDSGCQLWDRSTYDRCGRCNEYLMPESATADFIPKGPRYIPRISCSAIVFIDCIPCINGVGWVAWARVGSKLEAEHPAQEDDKHPRDKRMVAYGPCRGSALQNLHVNSNLYQYDFIEDRQGINTWAPGHDWDWRTSCQ